MSESISEKAKALKSKVENEMRVAEDEETRTRTTDLQEKLISEKAVKETQNKKNNSVSQKRSEIETLLQTGKMERTSLQREGKSVAKELRADEAGNVVLENEKYRNEVFGDTITKLKEINEATKSYRAELNQILDEAKEEREVYTKQKQERLNAFLAEHPEIGKLQKIAAEYERQLEYIGTIENETKELMNDPLMSSCLNDVVINDSYRGIVDITLKSKYEDREKKLDEIRATGSSEREKVENMKKGVFESRKSFDEKRRELFKRIKNEQQVEEDHIFRGEGNFNEINTTKERVEKSLDNILSGLGYYSEEKNSIVADSKNVQGLLDFVKKKIMEKREEFALSKEEQLLIDLNRELWS